MTILLFTVCTYDLDSQQPGFIAYMQHMHTFREHEKLQQARVEAQRSACEAIVEISVTSRVPKDLNSIFRKGADWDLGVDHILVLQVLLLDSFNVVGCKSRHEPVKPFHQLYNVQACQHPVVPEVVCCLHTIHVVLQT